MLMSGRGREARVHYLDGTFRLLAHGDFVRCAETGAQIPLDELRYFTSMLTILGASLPASAAPKKEFKELKLRLKTASRDIVSLAEHASFETNKVNFLLNATLGTPRYSGFT